MTSGSIACLSNYQKDELLTFPLQEYPPTRDQYARSFCALVGALEQKSATKAAQFAIDLLAPHIHAADLTAAWPISNPMAVLAQILANEGRGAPEPRLLWTNGPDTVMACYTIGIYSDKELVGQGERACATFPVSRTVSEMRMSREKIIYCDDCRLRRRPFCISRRESSR